MTNRDWLDEMDNDELGEFLEDVACGLYHVDWAYWLTLERQEDKQRGVKHDV